MTEGINIPLAISGISLIVFGISLIIWNYKNAMKELDDLERRYNK